MINRINQVIFVIVITRAKQKQKKKKTNVKKNRDTKKFKNLQQFFFLYNIKEKLYYFKNIHKLQLFFNN